MSAKEKAQFLASGINLDKFLKKKFSETEKLSIFAPALA
jgi:hypothetical protein